VLASGSEDLTIRICGMLLYIKCFKTLETFKMESNTVTFNSNGRAVVG